MALTSMVAPLRRVLVRRPTADGDFAAANWLSAPEPRALRREFEAFVELLDGLVDDVVVADERPGLVDAVYVHDPVLVTESGAIVLRAAKGARAEEPEALAADLERAGVPVRARLTEPAVCDGGDQVWIDERTLLMARGYRTNAAAHAELQDVLREDGVTVERCDLPHDTGSGSVLHLMSVLSPVTDDLAVVFEPLAPVTMLEALDARGIRRVTVDADEYATLGGNVLATAPGVVIVAEGNPRMRRKLEQAGCEVHAFAGAELALKGQGGPTCLTNALARA